MTSTLETQPAAAPAPAPSARCGWRSSGPASPGSCMARRAPAAGRDRLRRPGAGRRRRRHLAGQHLSGRGLRRAVQPLLVLLRAEPRLAALLLRAAGDPGLPAGDRRQVRRPRALRVRRRRHLRPLGRRRPPLAGDARRPASSARGCSSRPPGALADPTYPDIPGLDTFAGTVMHSARWDDSHDLAGERVAVIGTGASAIQVVPAIQPVVEQRHRLPAHAGLGRAPHRPPGQAADAALYRFVPGLQKAVRAALYLFREFLVHRHGQAAPLPQAGRQAGPGAPAQAGPRPEAARRPDAGLHDRLQAHPDQQRLLPGRRRAQRRAGHRRHRRGPPALDRRAATASSGRPTRSCWPPASTSPTCRSPRRSAAATAAASPRSGPTAWSATAAPPSPASRTCSCWSGPTSASGTPRWST